MSHPYQLFTKIITNRRTYKFDGYQQPEEAGFRPGFSTLEQIQNIGLPIEKHKEYNLSFHLAFIDYNKTFDSVISSLRGNEECKHRLQI